MRRLLSAGGIHLYSRSLLPEMCSVYGNGGFSFSFETRTPNSSSPITVFNFFPVRPRRPYELAAVINVTQRYRNNFRRKGRVNKIENRTRIRRGRSWRRKNSPWCGFHLNVTQLLLLIIHYLCPRTELITEYQVHILKINQKCTKKCE